MLVHFATTDVPPDRIATGLLHVCPGHILYALLLPRCCSSIAVDACFWVTSLRYLDSAQPPKTVTLYFWNVGYNPLDLAYDVLRT